jgi:DNA-binding transcriptional LysR family regulator
MGSGHKLLERTLEEHGIRRDMTLRLPHFMVAPMIVASTDRMVTVPSRVAAIFAELMKIRVYSLPIKIPHFEVSLFWHPRYAEDPGLRWMRDLMYGLFHEPSKPARKAGRR